MINKIANDGLLNNEQISVSFNDEPASDYGVDKSLFARHNTNTSGSNYTSTVSLSVQKQKHSHRNKRSIYNGGAVP